MRTVLRGAIAAITLSLAPLTVVTTTTVAPAQAAAAEVESTVTFDPKLRKRGEFGGFFSVSGEVTTADGSYPVGTAFLQRQAPGKKTWKNIGRDDSAGFAYFPDYDTYTGNAKFRIFYTGGTSGETVYPQKYSKPITVKVKRTIAYKDVSRGAKGRGKFTIKPQFAGKRMLIQTKRGGKFRTVRRAKANRKGVVVAPFKASRRGITYRVVAPKNRNFVTTSLKVTYRLF